MTPGPTEIPKKVRKAMGRKIQNPDIEEEFIDFYLMLEDKLKKVYGTRKDMLILGGEGILGLEASVASMIEKGDKVLCISNGIFGDGFADFVKMYGGEPHILSAPYDEVLDMEGIEKAVENDDFKMATMIHCETPTGVLNKLDEILELLKSRNIITVVDAVSSLGGVPVPTKDMDICIGGSQKCFSSPPGLTTVSVSEDAWSVILDGEQRSFYTHLAPWKKMWFEEKYFPYTHLVSNLYALNAALELLIEEGMENVFQRHIDCAESCRSRGQEIGLELYPSEVNLSSPTVTAFKLEGRAKEVQKKMMLENDIVLATGLGDLENDILRIGHMGNNARSEKVEKTMDALQKCI